MLTLTDCTVSGNSAASDGGGVYVKFGGTATLTNCTVSGNSAEQQRRRRVHQRRHGHADRLHRQRQLRRPATAAACTSIRRHGHADRLHRQRQLRGQRRRRPDQLVGTATLTDCTVSGNSAGIDGGGLINVGTATLTNCTVSGNSAGGNGGGL